MIDAEPVGVHAGSTDALPAAVADLLADPARRQTDGTAGREHVADTDAVTSVIDAYEAVFDRIDQTVLSPGT